MPLGMEVGLGPGDIALDGEPAPPTQRGTAAVPIFWAHVYCGQTVGWISVLLDTEVGLGPSDIVLDGDSPPPTQRGTAALPKFFGPRLL